LIGCAPLLEGKAYKLGGVQRAQLLGQREKAVKHGAKIKVCENKSLCGFKHLPADQRSTTLKASFHLKPHDSMRETISAALKAATKAQEKRRLSTLRLMSAAIKDRDIAGRSSGKDQASDAELLELFAKMIKQREESAKIYDEAGRKELADQEKEEIVIIREFLPKQLSDAETETAIGEAIAEVGAASVKDMGKVMSALKARYAGQMDFGKAGALVKAKLG
jgi:uncharacterized protein YqeY